MAQSSYQRISELAHDLGFERDVTLRMLGEATGIDANDGAAWVALIEEVDQRKAAYIESRENVA